jgi:hypothetical protein
MGRLALVDRAKIATAVSRAIRNDIDRPQVIDVDKEIDRMAVYGKRKIRDVD